MPLSAANDLNQFVTGQSPTLCEPDSRGHGIRNVLVCVDQSPICDAVLFYAVFLSKAFASGLTLLHVTPPQADHVTHGTPDAFAWEITKQEGLAYLKRLQAQLASQTDQRVDIRLEQGQPSVRIRAVARELGADIAVLGAGSESGATAWTLGTTAQQLLAHAECSMLVARPSSGRPEAMAPKRVLVPLDGSVRTESALPTAIRVAKASDAEVLLAHVVVEQRSSGVLHTPEDVALAGELATHLESEARTYLEHLRATLAPDIVSLRTSVLRHADPGQCLCELAESEQADMVVLSAHGTTCNPVRSFGSVTTHLLTYLPVPVVVLQDLTEPGAVASRAGLSRPNRPRPGELRQ
jgi:nucleotide-binding universal stress UspA family protein